MTATAHDGGDRSPIEPWRWGVVWLMFLATLINYMDRQTLGSTAMLIKNEFRLSETDYGWVEFWFSISYGLMQFPAGYLADRLSLRWLYPAALLLWSAAGFLTGMADTVLFLSACRFVLGVGEAFNWPCAVGLVRRLIPLESRSLANGVFHSGASAGAVLTPLLVLLLVGDRPERWRLLFQVVGALGLLWVVLWGWVIRGQRAQDIDRVPENGAGRTAAESAGPFFRVLFLRTFWITLVVGITVNVCWHFYRVWLPRFLDMDLPFTQNRNDRIQWVLMGFYVSADLGVLTAGWMTRKLTYAGFSVERSRKLVMLGTAALCLLSAPAALVSDPWLALPLISLVSAGAMGGFANFFALSQEISPRHTALCLGLLGCVSWLVIAAVNPPVGRLADSLGTYVPSLIVVGCVPMIGALVGLLWPEPRPLEIGITLQPGKQPEPA
jgi:ACS family hexuronate transporter-like MFS transporter